MIPTHTILTAAAQQLAATGIGVYNATGVYKANETGIVLKNMPTEPDRVIVLASYSTGVPANPADPVRVVMLQVRTRGLAYPPTDVDDLAESAVAALTGHRLDWPGLHVQRADLTSSTPLGADGNRRQERADNLRLILR